MEPSSKIFGVHKAPLAYLEENQCHALYVPESYALRDSHGSTKDIPLKKGFWGKYSLDDPEISFIRFIPHAQEKLLSWIKRGQVQIQDFLLSQSMTGKQRQPIPAPAVTPQWEIVALHTNDIEEAITAGYRDGLEGVEGLPITFDFDYHPTKGFVHPRLIVDNNDHSFIRSSSTSQLQAL